MAVWDCYQPGVHDALGTVMQPDRGCATEAAPHACQVQIGEGGARTYAPCVAVEAAAQACWVRIGQGAHAVMRHAWGRRSWDH